MVTGSKEHLQLLQIMMMINEIKYKTTMSFYEIEIHLHFLTKMFTDTQLHFRKLGTFHVFLQHPLGIHMHIIKSDSCAVRFLNDGK